MRAGHFTAGIAAVLLSVSFGAAAEEPEFAVIKCIVDGSTGVLLVDGSGDKLADQTQFDANVMVGKKVLYDPDNELVGYPPEGPNFYISEYDVVFADDGAVAYVELQMQSGGATSGAGLGSGAGDPCA